MLNVGRPDPFIKSELLPATAEISCQTPRMRTWSTHAREKTADVCKFADFLVMEFQIPLSREDLLRPSGGSQFFVSECIPPREIVFRLEGNG